MASSIPALLKNVSFCLSAKTALVQVVQLCSSCDTITTWKNFHLILSEILNFYVNVDLSIAVHAFPVHMLTLVSVNEMLLPSYVNKFRDCRKLSFNEKIVSTIL